MLLFPPSLHRLPIEPRPLHLKITGLKTFVVNVGGSNWAFCKIHTDQGLAGLGEGSITSKEATLVQAIMEHERFLIGQDPTEYRTPVARHVPSSALARRADPEQRHQRDRDCVVGHSRAGAWRTDLQAAGRRGAPAHPPVQRRRLDSGGLSEAKQEGYTAAKSTSSRSRRTWCGRRMRRAKERARLEAVRKAVGDDFDICIDTHGRLTTTMAVDFCTRIEELRPFFVEEATQLEDLGELALLRSKTKVPLATGERSFTKYGFSEFCTRHLVDYIQPDVCHAGGILELKKIGAMAETFRIEMAPHNPQSLVSTLASIHVDATTPASTIQEYSPNKPAWIQDLFEGSALRDQGRLRGTARHARSGRHAQ